MGNSKADGSPSLRDVGIRAFVFCLPLIGVWLLLEWFAVRLPDTFATKREQLAKCAEDVDTLILGPSNAQLGIAPHQLSGSAYNLAELAQTFYYDDALLEKELPQLPHLHRVIIGLHYLSMFWDAHTVLSDRQFSYAQVWQIPPERLGDRFDVRMWSHVAYRTPQFVIQQFRDALGRWRRGGSFFKPMKNSNLDDRGWWRADATEPVNLSTAEGLRSVEIHQRLMSFKNERRNFHQLEHLVATLRQRDIEVDLVALPVWRTYRQAMSGKYWAKDESDFKEIAHRYRARYLCLLDVPHLDADDFRDVQHLNPRGAVRFSTMLNALLEGGSSDRPRSKGQESTRVPTRSAHPAHPLTPG